MELAVAVLLLALVTLGVVIETRFRVAAIIREIREEARLQGERVTGTLQRIDAVDDAMIRGLREIAEGNVAQAKKTLKAAEETPKPHRPLYQFSSSEYTNGKLVKFSTCVVPGCRDVQREEFNPDGSPLGAGGDG